MIQNTGKQSVKERILQRFLALRHLSDAHIEYLQPNMSQEEAKEVIGGYLSNIEEIEPLDDEVDEEARKRLEALGYID